MIRCGVYSAAVNGTLPSLRKFSSGSAILNRVEPQSKQTNISENVKTPGFSRCLRPLKWIIISAVNSTSFLEEHNLQLIASPTFPLITRMFPTLIAQLVRMYCFNSSGYGTSSGDCNRAQERVHYLKLRSSAIAYRRTHLCDWRLP